MPSLTIKNLPSELYELIKQNAAKRRRSINSEIIVTLERAVYTIRIDPEVILVRVKALQKKIPLPPLTDKILQKAKNEGRP